MSGTKPRRRVAVTITVIALIACWSAAPAAAFTPPTGAKCQTVPAGYVGSGSNPDNGSWVWDGRLQWQMCMAKTSGGARYAKVQLSSPVTVDGYDRFTGLVNVYFQGCYGGNKVFSTITQTSRGVSYYDYGTAAGGRYYFPAIQTPSSTSTANSGYRVHIQTWVAAVVPRSSFSQVLALSRSGFASGPGTDANFYTGCFYL